MIENEDRKDFQESILGFGIYETDDEDDSLSGKFPKSSMASLEVFKPFELTNHNNHNNCPQNDAIELHKMH